MSEQEPVATPQGLADVVTPPTTAEDINLVALLDGGRVKKKFFLPAGGGTLSDTYFVEGQAWTGQDKLRFDSTGAKVVSQTRRSGVEERLVEADLGASARSLCEASITDFHLRADGRDVRYVGRASVWDVFGRLPAPVLEWVVKMLREFQGLSTGVPTPGGD